MSPSRVPATRRRGQLTRRSTGFLAVAWLGTLATVHSAEPDYSWGFAATLDRETGTVLLTTDFHGDPDPTRAEVIVPLQNAGGGLEGFVLVGAKSHFVTAPSDPREEWYLPWLWFVRLDTGLGRQSELISGACLYECRGVPGHSDRR